MHLALKDSLIRDTLHHITKNTHSPLAEIAEGIGNGAYTKKRKKKEKHNLTHNPFTSKFLDDKPTSTLHPTLDSKSSSPRQCILSFRAQHGPCM